MSCTIIIIIFTCIVSISAFYDRRRMDALIMWPLMVKEKNQYYRFITSGFIHADYMHLGFNMFTLYFFGRVVEPIYNQLFGKLWFPLFYLLALIASDIHTFVKYRDNGMYRSLGASGAVSAVLFASIVFAPWSKIYIFLIPIGIPAFVFGILYLIYCMYMANRGGDGINHNAHFWGALFGVVFTIGLQPSLFQYFLTQLTGG